eukprot:5005203-Amphidinium_carterae.1
MLRCNCTVGPRIHQEFNCESHSDRLVRVGWCCKKHKRRVTCSIFTTSVITPCMWHVECSFQVLVKSSSLTCAHALGHIS